MFNETLSGIILINNTTKNGQLTQNINFFLKKTISVKSKDLRKNRKVEISNMIEPKLTKSWPKMTINVKKITEKSNVHNDFKPR